MNISLYFTSIKVHIFWGGHKILRNFYLTFALCSKVKISQNFVAFSEYMNFKYLQSVQCASLSSPFDIMLTSCLVTKCLRSMVLCWSSQIQLALSLDPKRIMMNYLDGITLFLQISKSETIELGNEVCKHRKLTSIYDFATFWRTFFGGLFT